MSKGSNQRPREIPLEDFSARWEKIFGKKDLKEKKDPRPNEPKLK